MTATVITRTLAVWTLAATIAALGAAPALAQTAGAPPQKEPEQSKPQPSGDLAARGASPAAFGRRGIPAGGVAPPSNTGRILGRRALPAGRLAGLGATPDLHHGLLEDQSQNAQAGSSSAAAPQKPDDAVFDPLQPDFTVITMPTTLRLARFKSAFRLTHRFARPLGEGDFGDLVSDLFGFDSGAQIGLEFRISLFRGSQVGIYRTSDKTIDFFGQYSVYQEGRNTPVSIDALASIEGTNNFQDDYTPALGAVISKKLTTHGAIYVMPQWVINANLTPTEPGEDDDTFLLGLGARVRIGRSVYVVSEFAPRLAGHSPRIHYGAFGIEKRYGGHVFQLNVSNSIGTTPGQVARGGYRAEDWYIGFNLTRKFF